MSEQLERIPNMSHIDGQPMSDSNDQHNFSLMRMFSRRWLLATLLVILAMGVMVRLGIWQLDRLQQRRVFNERVLAQIDQPILELKGDGLNAELVGMEYRPVVAVGQYDHSQEVALRNQAWGNHYGVHLLTPLRILGSDQSVLVDRGWVPTEDFTYEIENWGQYKEPGVVEVHGVIRASQSEPDYGRRNDPIPPPGERLTAWYFANVEGIDDQITYSLLPVYIQQAPEASWTELPFRSEPDLDLSEGPHLGYAFQWFAFGALLGIGYPFFIRRQENRQVRVEDV